MTLRTGLIGRSLPHSLSPYLHSILGDRSYRLIELEPDELERFILGNGWDALNVTIPYKKAVIPYCAELTERAKAIGSVNALVRRGGKIIGDNTDYAGFCDMVRGTSFDGKKVAVLGSGGASLTVRAASLGMGAREVVVVSRSGGDAISEREYFAGYADTEKYRDADILVNATPVGMFPDVHASPVGLDSFDNLSAVFDLIYNPLNTRLILDAKRRGIHARGGIRMLCTQAHEARRFFGEAPSVTADAMELEVLRAKENVVFVGMPGCGKSTFARVIAERYKKTLTDTDSEIVKKAHMPIPEIFAKYGEAHFRDIEQEVVQDAAMQMGAVIATGGGAIIREENRIALRANSFVIWLDCPLDRLATGGRPLSSSPEAIEKLYRERAALYEAVSDVRVAVSPDNSKNIGRIIKALESHYKGVIMRNFL